MKKSNKGANAPLSSSRRRGNKFFNEGMNKSGALTNCDTSPLK